MKGLHCSIYRAASFPDCTNRGVTGSTVGHKSVTLIGDGINGPFEPSEDSPAIWLDYKLDPTSVIAGQLSIASVSWLRELGLVKKSGAQTECFAEDWTSKHRIVNVVARVLDENGKPRRGMFGGNYIQSSDSRFPTTAPIPVHDRFEY